MTVLIICGTIVVITIAVELGVLYEEFQRCRLLDRMVDRIAATSPGDLPKVVDQILKELRGIDE